MGEPAPQLAQPADVETAPKPVPLILLVDDDEITRIGMAGRLKRLGYRVIEAVDGSAGLAAIRVHRPDLVILDWMMPGMDGPSVCEAIRADPELRSSQVVLMTAHDRPEQIAEGPSRGADDFLSKAANKQEILARVQTGLRSSALVREIERTRDDLDRSHKLLSAKQHELESELQSAAAFVRAQLPLPGMRRQALPCIGPISPRSHWEEICFTCVPGDPTPLDSTSSMRQAMVLRLPTRRRTPASFLREDNLVKAVGSLIPARLSRSQSAFPLSQDGEYFTLWVGRLDLTSYALSYATAGHSGAF